MDVIKQPTCADRIKDELKDFNDLLLALHNDAESDENDDPALSVDEFRLINVCLSYGGPSSFLEIKVAGDYDIVSVNYRFSDWFDTAVIPVLECEPAYDYARYIVENM